MAENKLTREEVLRKVSKSGDLLDFYLEYKDDYEIAVAAVRSFGQAIRWVSDRLKDDETIVTLSSKDDPMGTNLHFASERLRDKFEIVSLFLYNDGNEYQYASERLRNDEKLVDLAISNGGSLYFASERLRDNEEIVKSAVDMDGLNLEWASERLRDNEEIVETAVYNDGRSIQYASERLRDDEKIVKTSIINGGGLNIYYASERLKKDPKLGLLAVQFPPVRNFDNLNCPLKELSDELRDNEEIVNKSVFVMPHSLSYASERLKDTYETVSIAFNRDKRTLQYASERMQLDQRFIRPWLDELMENNNETDVLKKIIITEFYELNGARGYVASNESKIPKLVLTNKQKETEE